MPSKCPWQADSVFQPAGLADILEGNTAGPEMDEPFESLCTESVPTEVLPTSLLCPHC